MAAMQNLGLSQEDLIYPSESAIRSQPVKPEFKEDSELFYQIKLTHLRERCNLFI